MKNYQKLISLLGILLLCCFCTACGNKEKDTTEKTAEVEDTNIYCPFDGSVVDALPDRLFVVAVDNGPKSEPQTNLGQADFLFEVPVEGGINRFLAFYYHNQPDVIGPVRSARHPFIPLVNAYDGIYVHCGGSYMFEEQRANVTEIDEKANSAYFWRDNSRNAPVNLYTSYEKLGECADAKGFATTGKIDAYDFYSEKEAAALQVGDNTSVEIPYTYKPIHYTWDNEAKHYLRFSNGEAHMDAADNTQLYADNLIVMYMDVFPAKSGEILMDMTFVNNSGEGYLFQNGSTTQIKWSMKDADSTIKFTNGGKEVQLISGRTIVQVVPNTVDVSYDGTIPVTENQ